MIRGIAPIVLSVLIVQVVSAAGQSPTNLRYSDADAVCQTYGDSELLFVGRGEEPITFHISGEAEIEKARQNLISTEAEIARLRASLDTRTKWEREGEFELRIAHATSELQMRRAMYPPPYDLTLVPVRVEQSFRGVTESMLLLHPLDPSMRIAAGEPYLIEGYRSKNLVPPFPEMSDLNPATEYVDSLRVTHTSFVQKELQFLAATAPGATILGTLRKQSYGDGPAGTPLNGIRIFVSSEGQNAETYTREDGSFIVSGIQSGRVVVRARLPNNLTIVNKSALTFAVSDGGCRALRLTVELNGRVRGRIISASGSSLDGVELILRTEHADRFTVNSNDLRITGRPKTDGTFELSGVPPGSYILSAGVERMEAGKRRYLVTFFPGTSELTAAVPIVVGNATLDDGFNFLVTTE